MAAGVVLDALFGDPRRLHLVAGFGWVAQRLERRLWRPRRRAGLAHLALLAGGATAAVAAAERSLARSRALKGVWRAGVIWVVLGGRSLGAEAIRLGAALGDGDLAEARRCAPALVGRDPAALGAAELARATVESVAENTSDAVVGSLVWCALGGVPGAAAHRAVNTLDAMIGHRSERYADFGWASARCDDAANWLPARLTAALAILVAPVVGGTRLETARVVRRDGAAHPSPNAGRVEAAFAGALSLRLGGLNRYGDRFERRPPLGTGREASVDDIGRAVTLSRAIARAALVLCAALAWSRRR